MTDKTQAHLPVTPDTRLWCLHHIGPDDVHPAPDFATAQKWADWANLRFAEHSDLSRFVVAIWPWSAERHAEGLAKSIEEWTLPAVGFDKEWCISMAKQEAGYAIGAGELAIDPFTSPSAEAYAANMKSAGEKIGRDLADQAQAAANLRRGLPISHSLPGDVGRSEWMNLMPREVVARAALGEGCRDETADNIRYGFHRDVKIRAEVAVKLVASIQDDVLAALTPSALSVPVGDDIAKGLRTSQKALDEIARQEQANIAGYLALRDFPIGSASAQFPPDEVGPNALGSDSPSIAAQLREISRISNKYDLRECIEGHDDALGDSYIWRDLMEQCEKLGIDPSALSGDAGEGE